MDAFKVFKAEVENQCGKQIQIVRSDRGSEYYGRYTEIGQAPGPFAKFLQEHGIVAQYTMFGSLNQNGVAEKMKSNFSGHGVENAYIATSIFLTFCGLRHLRWQCIY